MARRTPKVEEAFTNLAHAVRWAGIDATGLALQIGSKANGIAYRLYVTPSGGGTGHGEWNYAPPGGYLGMTAGEAVKTLDIMRHVFTGIALNKEKV